MSGGEVRTATVTAARLLGAHVRELTLRSTGEPLAFAPGQWLSLRLPVGERPPLVRAYSLAEPTSQDGTLVVCFDKVEGGEGSGYLWEVDDGATVEFTGPLGNFTLPDGDAPLLLLARFTGVVPFRAMLLALERGDALSRPVCLIHAAAEPDELTYGDELTALAGRAPWFEYVPIVGADADDPTRLLPDGWPADGSPFVPMVCGVREFTKPLRDLLMERHGFERRAVKVENYNGPAGGR